MPVETLTALPTSLIAGDTTIISLADATYPATLWTLDLVLSRGGANLKVLRATADGTGYLLTFTASGTAGLAPGKAQVFLCYTEIATSQRITMEALPIYILPNPLGTVTKTAKQLALDDARAVLTRLSAQSATMTTVMQMQTVTRAISQQRAEVDRLQAEVWAEMRAAGIKAPGGTTTYAPTF